VDSGAIDSIFRQSVGERMGLEMEEGRLIYSQIGDGGFTPGYLHELDIQLGSKIFLAAIGFNILGRTGVFDRFIICFDDMKNHVTFAY